MHRPRARGAHREKERQDGELLLSVFSVSRCVRRLAVLAPLLAAALADAAPPVRAQTARLTHGVASGEVSATSAVVWARCDRPATLHVAVRDAGGTTRWAATAVDAGTDLTGKIRLDRLSPATAYSYRAWCGAAKPDGFDSPGSLEGSFRTAPLPDTAAAVRFAWSGDLGGQNVCRDAGEGYTVLDRLAERPIDFFVALGDMVYADDPCRAEGRYGNAQVAGPPAAVTLDGYRAHWKYNRDDAALRRLLAALPYYAVWDDHEIYNDAGPRHDVSARAPGRHLLPIARRAFLEFQPMLPPPAEPARLHRSVRWGKHLEIFLLDTRQYRDANAADDDAAAPKSMLGRAQRAWLVDGLATSDATWKIVVCSDPISIPTGKPGARDGWANFDGTTGFENELRAILTALRARGTRHLVWLTTDVHFATAFRYEPFPEDPEFRLWEFTSGPLNAGVFPRPEVDDTFHPERLFFHGPAQPIRSYAEAKSWFNFGVVGVSAQGALTIEYFDADGKQIFAHRLRD